MIILASESRARAAMLRAAGVTFETAPAHVDEAAIKQGLTAEGASPRDIADALAEAKAVKVSRRIGGLVIGADSVLDLEGACLNKPETTVSARRQLIALRGKTHHLHSAAVVAEAGAPVWRSVQSPKLAMRAFSDDYLDDYLAVEGDAVLGCVGAYRLEGLGATLFDAIEGDYFAVLGLPLIPLLGYLRARGALAS